MSDPVKHPTPNDPDTAWFWIALALGVAFWIAYFLV